MMPAARRIISIARKMLQSLFIRSGSLNYLAKRPSRKDVRNNIAFYSLSKHRLRRTMRNFDDHHRRIRDGNAEAVGAASALFAVLIVGGFLFFSLKNSEFDLTASLQNTSGYGVTPATTGAARSR